MFLKDGKLQIMCSVSQHLTYDKEVSLKEEVSMSDIYEPPIMYEALWDSGTDTEMMLGRPDEMKIDRQRLGSY